MTKLATVTAVELVKWASLEVRAEPGPEVVHSPVTGQPCAYWRLRVVERLTAGSDLVHELASSERFDLTWGAADLPLRVRLDPASARIEGTPDLHRVGTPGALAVSREFGFVGAISVEETIIRAGEVLDVEGVLESAGQGAGTFRGAEGRLELFDATVRQRSRSLGPVLLPWALGTAAAVLSGLGFATWAAWHAHLAHPRAAAHAFGVGVPARITPPTPLRPRLP
jgi:hypothetical protein